MINFERPIETLDGEAAKFVARMNRGEHPENCPYLIWFHVDGETTSAGFYDEEGVPYAAGDPDIRNQVLKLHRVKTRQGVNVWTDAIPTFASDGSLDGLEVVSPRETWEAWEVL